MKVGAVIVAAGRGQRAGGGVPKQWRALGQTTVAVHAVKAFSEHPDVTKIVLVVHPDDIAACRVPDDLDVEVVHGGETRSASVLAGLQALSGLTEMVLIHDAARPCVSEKIISDVISGLSRAPVAAPAIPVVDALWHGAEGRVVGTADRSGLFRAQTPQGFDLDQIIAAHHAFPDGAADDVEIARSAGLEVVMTRGEEENLKITVPEDFARAETILRVRNGH